MILLADLPDHELQPKRVSFYSQSAVLINHMPGKPFPVVAFSAFAQAGSLTCFNMFLRSIFMVL